MQALTSALVVVEKEAVCPYWMEHWGPAPEEAWSMLEQEEWEPDTAFAERLHTTLARSCPDHSDGETVLFVVGSRMDHVTAAERWSRATSLMTHLAKFDRGQLILTRGYGYDDCDDAMLSELADELREAWADTGVAVRVQLAGDDAPASRRVTTIAPPPETNYAAA